MLKIVLGVGVWLLASYLMYLRFPNNYTQPNFFGEEGNVFGENLYQNGFFQAIGTPFNGYHIWVIYILEQIAYAINHIFFGNEFIHMARSFAVTSYIFMGFIAVFPLLLLRRIIKLPALLLTTLFLIYVPLGWWDYGVLGTMGNAKFASLFIAFILLIYRHYLPSDSRKVYLADAGLLACAYTNVTVYIMMLFALTRYWPKLINKNVWKNLKNLVTNDRTAQSLLFLGVALLPQLYFIARDGVPELPGYLDSPYRWDQTIEIFISRSYLYQFLFPINKFLNNTVVVISFIAILVLLWRFARKYRQVVVFGLLTIFVTTLLFVSNRTGVSEYFINYKDAGPSQFFFPQNWMFAFLVSILLVEIINRFKRWQIRYGIYTFVAVGFVWFMLPLTGSFGKNDFQERTVGNIYAVAQKACQSSEPLLDLTMYPTPDLAYHDLPRERVCTKSVINYQPEEIDFGLKPYGGNYYTLSNQPTLKQTFLSPQPNLNGLNIYFSTFMRRLRSPYTLTLLDESCSSEIRKVAIKTRKLTDNAWYVVEFPVITSSSNKSYCFTVTADRTPSEPLALQLSAPNIYPAGTAYINGQPSDLDTVFALRYKNTKL